LSCSFSGNLLASQTEFYTAGTCRTPMVEERAGNLSNFH